MSVGRTTCRRRHGRAFGLATACALIFGTGCDDAAMVVGSKNFTEQAILGELVAQQIERRTGLAVERRLYLGGTFVCHRAITSGEIDVYVEYTGTAFTAILRNDPISDPEAVYRRVSEAYEERFDLVWSEPLGFDNTFAMIVRQATADSLDIETLSEAAPHASGWRAGFGPEFLERKDGFPGLSETYGIELSRPPRIMDIGLMYRAVAEGQVDLIAGNSTDGQIEALDLFVLEDDRDYFPPYEAAPVIRRETLERYPEVRAALDELAGRLSDADMRALNRRVDLEGRDVPVVVREWLERG